MPTSALEEILAALGPAKVRMPGEVPERNWSDAAGLEPVEPLALVMPQTSEDVSAVLAICHRHGQPVVIQGGLTGLAGGAHPDRGEIALSLERMIGIEEVDVTSGTLTALAGTPLRLVQQAAEDAMMTCGIDLGARGSCTIGGNVATNAGGNQVLRYGMTRRNVLGLEAVTADGSVVRSLNKMTKNNAGYDWTQLFIGSEGTLGVVTRVTLALQPRLPGGSAALIALRSTDDAIAVLRAPEQLPFGLLVFEAMWREFYDIAVTTMGADAPLGRGSDLYVLVEAPAASEADDALQERLASLYEEGKVSDAVIARSEADRRRFWALRESVYDYDRHFTPGAGFDISIPLDRMSEAIAAFRADLPTALPGVTWVAFGYLADSNIHLQVIPPQLSPSVHTDIEKLVYARTTSFRGSISAEHGIGRTKKGLSWPVAHRTRTSAHEDLEAGAGPEEHPEPRPGVFLKLAGGPNPARTEKGSSMSDGPRFRHDLVERATLDALRGSGADEPSAAAATRALMHASLLGVDSHGVRLVAHYCAAIAGGRINGAPRLGFRRTAAATGMLDADDGLGHAAAYRGMRHACELASESGVGVVTTLNSSHVGAAGAYALAGAEAGFLSLFTTNSDSGVNLFQGKAAFHGTNPIAAAAPVTERRPWLLDMATSAIPFNRIYLYRSLGLPLPPDTAVDANGVPTADAAKAAALVPLGGAGFGFKGAGLASLVTILSAVLGGGTVDDLVVPMAGPDFATPRNLGQFCLAIDPERFAGAAEFAETMANYLDRLRKVPASSPPMAPGDREWAVETERRRAGIPLDPKTAAFLGLRETRSDGGP